jgi:hypothetical protein
MTFTIRATIFAASALALGMAASTARAGDDVGVVVDATMIKPLGEEGRVSNSLGYGAEIRMMPHRECFTASIGGFFGLGQPEGEKTMRDIYDFHFNIGLKTERSRDSRLIPFVSIGLNVLYMTTHEPDDRKLRGTTLGLNARAGVMGHLTERWIYRVSGSYLGAIVPGTGDDLGGLVLQAGIGKMFD